MVTSSGPPSYAQNHNSNHGIQLSDLEAQLSPAPILTSQPLAVPLSTYSKEVGSRSSSISSSISPFSIHSTTTAATTITPNVFQPNYTNHTYQPPQLSPRQRKWRRIRHFLCFLFLVGVVGSFVVIYAGVFTNGEKGMNVGLIGMYILAGNFGLLVLAMFLKCCC